MATMQSLDTRICIVSWDFVNVPAGVYKLVAFNVTGLVNLSSTWCTIVLNVLRDCQLKHKLH